MAAFHHPKRMRFPLTTGMRAYPLSDRRAPLPGARCTRRCSSSHVGVSAMTYSLLQPLPAADPCETGSSPMVVRERLIRGLCAGTDRAARRARRLRQEHAALAVGQARRTAVRRRRAARRATTIRRTCSSRSPARWPRSLPIDDDVFIALVEARRARSCTRCSTGWSAPWRPATRSCSRSTTYRCSRTRSRSPRSHASPTSSPPARSWRSLRAASRPCRSGALRAQRRLVEVRARDLAMTRREAAALLRRRRARSRRPTT